MNKLELIGFSLSTFYNHESSYKEIRFHKQPQIDLDFIYGGIRYKITGLFWNGKEWDTESVIYIYDGNDESKSDSFGEKHYYSMIRSWTKSDKYIKDLLVKDLVASNTINTVLHNLLINYSKTVDHLSRRWYE